MGKSRTLSRARGHSGASANSSRGHSGASANSSRGGDSWQPPSLTASERAYMIRKAKEASVALVDHAHTLDGPVQWHYTGKFRGIQMYRGEGSYDRVGTNGTEFLCGVTTMMGTIEEVASYFDQQTTERMLAKKAEDVLDCGVLYSLVQRDPNNPYYRVSAKYQLYEGPSAFSRERDYCFLECQNTFRHASGRRGWVLSMHSIKLPNCPEVDGVVRGSMYQSGYVFVESEKEGYMDVMHSLQINFKSTSRLPHFLLNSALKRRILSVVTISREIQTSRMGRQTLLKKKDLMPKRARALCVNCSRKFSLFVRKTRCRVCGEVVCQPCAPQLMISTKRGPVKTRVCTKCYHLSPGDEYEPIGALPNSQNGGDPRRMQNETRYSDILQDHPDMCHDPDEDSMDEDEDEDGLEEQSDYSVFAQSRFTEASRDSVATSNFGASSHFESHFDGSSQFDATSELDDSQYYDGGASESSFVSGTSTSNWQGGNSTASSMMGWNQASSVRPADGYIYDPQASMMTSNFYGASKYSESDYGTSNYTVEEEREKRTGKYKAAAPIPEDEPDSRNGYTISPNTSYNSSQNTDYNSGKASKFNLTQGTNYDASNASYNSNASHVSKTVSIQSLAKARSARYGIKSQFPPPPPPPPPLSPPPEEADEDGEDDSPLHLGALKSEKARSLKDRKPKGIAARKMFTPPPPKEGRRENGLRKSTNRAPKASLKEYSAAQAGKDSRSSQASSRDSHGFGSTRSSAILQQMRRNRNRTIQLTPDSDRSSAVLKTLEEEHLNRMREIERLQDLAKEKAARRSMASNGSRSSLLSDQPSQTGGHGNNARASAAFAAAVKKTTQPRHNGPSSPTAPATASSMGPPSGSPPGPPPGSPPGTPPSMRGRRMPPFNQQANQSFGSRSRHTDNNSDFGGSRLLSTRSNGTFAKSNVRVSVAPSAQSEDLVFNSQRSGFQASKGSNSSSRGRRLDASQASSKSSNSSFSGRRLDVSQTSSISMSKTPDNLAFDESQLSVDKSKFSSSIAILETPDDTNEHVAMMERLSSQRGSNSSTLFDEDLLGQSSAGMAKHINSMRARAAYQLPDEEDRVSDELLKRQQEHRRRMEELTKLTANHVVEDNIRDSASSLGDLHDSSISLNGFRSNSGNHLGDSSVSSASSVDIDDDEFDFESRPLGRTKRSGTIPFSLEELGQVPNADEDEELSEGPDDSDTSFRLSEDPMEHEHDSDKEDAKPSYRSSEESLEQDRVGSMTNVETSFHPRMNAVDHDHPAISSSEASSEHKHPPMYRTSEDSVEHEHVNESVDPDYRSSEEPAEYNHESQRAYRPSEESMENKPMNDVRPDYRSSEESFHQGGHSEQGREEAANRFSEESVERQSESKNSQSAHRLSEDSIERNSEMETGASAFRLREEQKGEHGHGEPSYFSSDESEPEDADAAYRSSEEPVAPQKNVANFQPHTSQLIPGEGGVAVDEFFADSSRLIHNEKLSQVDECGNGDEDTRSPRDTSEFHQDDLQFIPEEPSTQDFKQPPVSSSTISTEGSEHIGSPRESCVSALDESLMNRPTEELFEQVRANRPIYSNGPRSSNLELHDLEASHIRRMEELNRIALDHLGNRISNLDDDLFGSSYQPGRSLYLPQPKLDDDEEEMQWRSTDVMEEYEGRHQQDMERLRRKIRQLEEECRESIKSVLTPEEMDLSEFDNGDEEPMSGGFNSAQSANGSQSFNPQSSFVSTKDLSSSTLSQPMLLQVDEPGSVRALYDQIAKLTQLQREMAMAENDDDEEEYRARIKEQYRLLRTIKATSYRLRITEPRSPRKTTSWQPTFYEELCTKSESKTPNTTTRAHSFPRTAVITGKVVATTTNEELYTKSEYKPPDNTPSQANYSKAGFSNKKVANAGATTTRSNMTHVSALDESCVSAFDESLMNRPTEELFEQVRANRPKASADAVRSSDLQLHDLEASHNRRMQELNRIALDQLGNRISNLGHDRLSGSYYPQSSQLTAGEGGMAVDEFFAGSSIAAASTSGKLAQVAEQRDDREEDARSSRETSGSQQDIDEEQRSTSMSASESESERESAAKSATEVKSSSAMSRSSTSSSAALKSDQASVPVSDIVVPSNVLASSALSMSALSSSAVATGALVKSANATNTAAMTHVSALDESCVSAFDESLMNRPTEELFEQVRANRPKASADAVRSSDLQLHDLEASHNRRMQELNRIALDQLGNRISNLGHDRLSGSYYPQSSQLTAGEGGMAVDEFFAGSSIAAASTSGKLAQVAEQRDDREEDARSSRETSGSQQDIDEEQRSTSMSASESESERESAAKSATEVKSSSAMSRSSTSSSAALKSDQASVPVSDIVVPSNVLASSALSMSALSSSAVATGALVKSANATNTAAMTHVSALDESCVSAFDESLMNRPTEELFEQVRANRPKASADAVRSSDLQLHDLEASHNRRMQELNRIALDQLGNRISNLGHDRLSGSYYPQSSQLTAGEGGMAVDEFFAGSSIAAASTSGKLAQVAEQRDDREEDARSSRETSGSQQDIDEEQRSTSMSASESESERESAAKSATEVKSSSAMSRSSTSSSAALKSDQASVPVSDIVVPSNVLASSALSMSALSSSAVATGALVKSANATNTAAMTHVSALDESCVSAFDESLMNRPTEELFEQVRANRPKASADAVRSSDLQLHDLEASHNRRMQELNRIALDQLGNRISNLGHDRLSGSYYPQSSQLTAGEGGMAVDEFFAGSSIAAASTSGKLAQVAEQRDDREEDARSSRETSGSQQDIDEEQRSTSMSASESESERESAAKSATEVKSSSAMSRSSTSSSAALKSDQASVPVSDIVVPSNVLASSALSMSALSSSAVATGALVKSANATNTAAMTHVSALDESCVSAFDESLMNRPTEELFEQVRANRPKASADAVRSSDLQLHDLEASHNRRMQELNRIALDQLGNRISNLGHDRLSGSYYPQSSQLTAGEGGMAVDEFFAGSSIAAASTSGKLAQVAEQRDDREEDARSSRETSGSQQDIDEEQRSTSMSASESESERESAAKSATEVKSSSAMSRSSTSSSAALKSDQASVPVSDIVVPSNVLASSALSMSALSSSAVATGALVKSANATNTAAMTHVSALDESCVSAFDESLMNRPTEELFEQVRANRPKASADAVRSSDLQLHDLEASHNRRMQELNRIALGQLGNRISNLGHDRLSGSYYPQSSQLTAGEGGMAVDEFFAGSSIAAASTSGKLAQVAEQRDDREEDARSSRETSGSQQDIDEEQRSTSMSASESESERESAAKSATEVKSSSAMSRSSTSSSAALKSDQASVPVSDIVVPSNVLASSALSMSALSSSAVATGALVKSANATNTAAMTHVSALDESCVSAFDESLMNRPTEELFEQVRANRPKASADAVRSSDLQLHDLEASHNRRMQELNRIALGQLGNRISNLGHDRLSGSYYPQSSQLTAGEGGMAVDEFFAGSSIAAASTSGKLAQVAEQRDDREEDARSSRETSGSQQDIDEEQRSTSMSASESESERESAAKSATEVKSSSAMSRSSTSSSAALKSDQASVPVSDIVVPSNVLASSALSMSALSSSAVATGALVKSANATNTAAMTHVSALDESCVSAFDESLMNRPTEELFEQVRANRPKASADAVRSSDLQLHDLEASHNRRMQELNRIALGQLGNRISNLGHDRLSGSYYPQSSQLTAGEGGMAVDEFFAGSSIAAASTSGKLAQVAEQRDDREEDARSSRETSGSQQDIDEEQRSTSMSASESESERESAAKSATEVKSSSAMSRSSTSSSAALKSDQASVPVSDIVVPSNVLASSALSMSALFSSAVATGALVKSANATNTAAMTHVSALDESCVSAFDESLMNRPTEELFEQVRANRPKASADAVRSSDLQLHDLEASHNRRMQELNRIALGQLGNRISNLGHDRLSGSYYPQSSQLTAGEGGMAVDEFFAGSSIAAASTSGKLAQVAEQRDDREEDARSSRETSGLQQDIDEEQRSTSMSASESESERESAAKSATEVKSSSAMSRSSTSSSAALKSDQASVPVSDIVVPSNVLASSALSMSALSSSAVATGALVKSANATNTAAMTHVSALDESCVSAFDESLMNRPTEELFEQVRANRPKASADAVRSSDLQLHDLEASHNRRMQELNRIALDQLGNRISNLGHDRLSGSYYPQSSQLTAGEGGMAVDEFFAGSSIAAASTSGKLAQVAEQRDDREEDARSSRETSGSQQDIDEEQRSTSMSASESESERESAAKSATEVKSSSAMSRSSTSSSAALKSDQASVPVSDIVVPSNVLASSALSMSALSSSAVATGALVKSANATNTAAMTHVSALDESCVSAFDESLMNRPTEELFEQVRANRPKASADAVRSSDLQLHDLEASHNRRMQELNRIALDQLGNRISNLGHDRLSGSYYPQSSQLTAGEGGMAVDEFFAGSSIAAASTSGKLAQVAEQRDDREEDARSSRETSGSQQDIDEEQRSTSMSASESESERESAAKSATEVKSSSAMSRSSTSSSAALKSDQASVPVSDIVVPSNVLASSALSMSALSSSAVATGALVKSANATNTAAMTHVSALDESCVSAFDESLMNRPTEELFEQVRANRPKASADAVRSSDLQLHDLEASHNRRMQELNRIALDQLGNRISNLGHDRLSGSYYPQSSQLTAGEGGMAVDEFFAGSSIAAASTSGKLAQVAEQRDDREEDARSSRETSGSQQDIDEEQRSTSMSASESESERESAAKSATEVKSSSAMSRSSTSSSAALKSDQASVPVSDIVVPSNVLASSALSMSALSSSAVATGALVKSANATNTAAMTHVSALDESCVSAFDESLMNRPTEELFEQVRANRPKASADAVRSSDLQLHDLEASHNRRMQELNRIALGQLGNRISNLGHDRLSGSYYPQSSQLTAGEGGMAVDEFFAGSSIAAASTSGKLAQVAEQRDDREEDARSSRETSGSQQDIDEEQRSTSMSASESESERESAAKSATEVKSSSAMSRSSTSSSAALKSDQASVPVSDIVVPSNVLASSALSMSALSSSAVATGALVKSANATNTAAMTHVSALDESCVSAFDESLMNRPTEELFEQVRANRPKASADAVRSSDLQLHDLEASHNRRMQELNRIALDQLGNRISNLDRDGFAGSYPSLRSIKRNEDKENELQTRSKGEVNDFKSRNEQEVEKLRRKIRQLEREVLESSTPKATLKEMNLADLDDAGDKPKRVGFSKTKSFNAAESFVGNQSFNPQSSFISIQNLSSSALPPPKSDKRGPARAFHDKIAKMTLTEL